MACGGPLPGEEDYFESSARDPASGGAEYEDPAIGSGGEPGFDEPDGSSKLSAPRLKLLLTDAPLDEVDEVNVTFDSIEVAKYEGDQEHWVTVTSSVQTFDLLSLQNGVVADLGLAELSTGTYGQIRLHLIDSWLVIAGEEHDLFVPSGAESGLKLNHSFEMQVGVETEILLDFDAGMSVHRTGAGQWMMRPVIFVAGASEAPIDAPEADEEAEADEAAGEEEPVEEEDPVEEEEAPAAEEEPGLPGEAPEVPQPPNGV
jgi:hypothetical protein